MRFHAKGGLIFLVLYMTATIAPGQEKRSSSNGAERVALEPSVRQHKGIASKPLTLSEGLAILGAALDSRHSQADFSSDCSHFVHGLYERAGFAYEYSSSSDLYEGTDAFRQVVSPQPGDMVVWPGHAGIVVNPDQHSFFSVLHAGPGVDAYDSPYWKLRGRPRFFRYLNPAQGGAVHKSIHTASWQPVLNDTEAHESAHDGRVPGTSKSNSTQSASSARPPQNQPAKSETPSVVILTSVRPKPGQVSAAYWQACNDSEEMLRGRDLFKSTQSVVVFDQFEVKKIHFTGNQGWIEIQIDELASITKGKLEVREQSERQRWGLRRDDKKSWKLTPSRNAIYLPRHTAERILAHELAQLADDTSDNAGGTQEKAEMARLLDVLFAKYQTFKTSR